MLKIIYELGWSLICAVLCCALTLTAITTFYQSGDSPDHFLLIAAVLIGSVTAGFNRLLISMAEALGFWSNSTIKPYLLSGTVLGLLLGSCVSGIGSAQGLGMGILIALITSIGSWIGLRVAFATTSKGN